jgi:hypothetical protein
MFLLVSKSDTAIHLSEGMVVLRTCCDLIANSCEHEAKGNEEFCCAAIKVLDDGWHIPLEVTPDDGMGRCNENGRQSAESANDRKSEELMISFEAVLGETAEILVV